MIQLIEILRIYQGEQLLFFCVSITCKAFDIVKNPKYGRNKCACARLLVVLLKAKLYQTGN